MTTDNTSFLGLDVVEDAKGKFLKLLTGEKGRAMPFGQILAELRSKAGEGNIHAQSMVEAFEHVTAADVRASFSPAADGKDKSKTKGKKEKKGLDVPALKNAKDPEERTAFRDQIVAFLVERGLGESGRGWTPVEIRTAVGRGNDAQTRDVLAEIVDQGSAVSTGLTKGKRYAPIALAAQAKAKEAEEAAAKEAKEAAKAAKASE